MHSKAICSRVVKFCLHHSKGEAMRVLYQHEVSRLDGCPPTCSGAFESLVHLYVLAESEISLDLGRFETLIRRLDSLADQHGVAAFLYNELEAVTHPDTVSAIRSILNAPESEVDLATLMAEWLSFHRRCGIGELSKPPAIGPQLVVDGLGVPERVRNEH